MAHPFRGALTMGHGVLRPGIGSGRSTRAVVTALVVGLTVAVALLALLVAGLLRAHAEVLRTLRQMGVNLDEAKDETAR